MTLAHGDCILEGNFVNGKLHGPVRGLTKRGRHHSSNVSLTFQPFQLKNRACQCCQLLRPNFCFFHMCAFSVFTKNDEKPNYLVGNTGLLDATHDG